MCSRFIHSSIHLIFISYIGWIQTKAVQKLVLVVSSLESLVVLERWQFDIQLEPLDDSSSSRKENSQPIHNSSSISLIQKEIQMVMRQITASVSFLPVLQENCSFELLVYTDRHRVAANVPADLWVDSDPKLVINSETVKLKSFSTSLHQVDSFVSYKK